MILFKKPQVPFLLVKSALVRPFSSERAKRYLCEALGQIPGVPAKFQQFLGFGIEELQAQVDSASEMQLSLSEVKGLIEQRSPSLAARLESLSEEGVSASLGQVHRGRLMDGREVAIKILYPEMQERIQEQLSLLLKAAKLSPAAKYSFDATAYEEMLRAHFQGETNYLREAEEQELWYAEMKGQGVVVPKVFREFSTHDILVQGFEASQSMFEVSQMPLEMRERCAVQLVQGMLTMLERHQRLHGDLQPANWGFQQDQCKLVLYDFGAVLKFEKSDLARFKKLIQLSMSSQDDHGFLNVLADLGFDTNKLQTIRSELPVICHSIVTKMMWSESSATPRSSLGDDLERILGARKWWLRTAGPPWFFMLLRAISFMEQSLKGLKLAPSSQAQVSKLLREFFSLSEEFSVMTPQVVAANLVVQVFENGIENVYVEMPARALEEIENLISPETQAAIRAEGIDLSRVKREVMASGFQPQTIVDITVGVKKYSVVLR